MVELVGYSVLGILLIVLSVALIKQYRGKVSLQRLEYIRSFELPMGLFDRLRKKRSSITIKDCQLVAQGMRHFFLAYYRSGCKFVSMPSQVVDDLWHEFILYTKDYNEFCNNAFGRFLHHTPAVALGDGNKMNAGLRRCWYFVCREENINPRNPTRLPLMFAIDSKLDIPDGFRYVPNCGTIRSQNDASGSSQVYCGTDFINFPIRGHGDGFGDSSSGHGDGNGDSLSVHGMTDTGSDSGGSSGDGCGGGCGGGGCGGGD